MRSAYSQRALDQDQETLRIAQLWSYHGGYNQLWFVLPVGNEQYEFRNAQNGKCLDIQAGDVDVTENGHYAHFWDCHSGANQR